MPTLQFKGKNIIWNHHLSVPYYTLEEVEKLRFRPEKANGNIIVEGDNLLALKTLLPKYGGRIKCVYIDPPYNTGAETGGWVYNDNVNSPMIMEWFGKEVGIDDLTRHDKWLCMMVPRLKILFELLSDDGIMFVSIDDYEFHNLKSVADEIFGTEAHLATFVWRRRASSEMTEGLVSRDHEYVLCYKRTGFQGFRGTKKDYSSYSNPDNDPEGDWTPGDLTVGMTKEQRPNQFYKLKDPKTGKVYPANPKRVWSFIPESMDREITAGHVIFPIDAAFRPMLKRYKKNLKSGVSPVSTWIKSLNEEDEENLVFSMATGLNSEGTKEIQRLFGSKVFDYPKPLSLVKTLIYQATNDHSIILDSFAGSGTTMHAVMDLNKEDGGSRQCILIQMTEVTEKALKKNVCKDITQERIKRAIEKYGYNSGFNYYKVGIPIDAETLLSGKLPSYNQFAEYVFYLCTGKNLTDKSSIDEKKYFIGDYGSMAILLVYKQNFEDLTHLALNLKLAEMLIVEHPKKKLIIYAPACFLEEDYMREKSIEFVGIPYNLFQKAEA